MYVVLVILGRVCGVSYSLICVVVLVMPGCVVVIVILGCVWWCKLFLDVINGNS